MSPRGRYVLVVGNIGTGKTTLAKALGERFAATHYSEPFASNPFLAAFYKEPAAYALRSQLAFLLAHFQQHCQIAIDRGWSVKDGSIFDSAEIVTQGLYRQHLLTPHEWRLYEELSGILKARCAPPALTIALTAEPRVLLQRIRGRGRQFEEAIELGYLEVLNGVYDEWTAAWSRSPIVRIDSGALDANAVLAAAMSVAESVVA